MFEQSSYTDYDQVLTRFVDERFEQLPYPASSEWNKLLQDNDFSGLEPATKVFDHIGQSCYCVISTAVASTQRLMVNILPDAQGKLFSFANQQSSSLADNGTASTISPTLLYDLSSKFIYIVLDDGSASLSDYEKLSRTNNVLWISMEQRDMNVVTRFARGARKENEGLKLVTLDAKQNYPDSGILKVVTRIIQVSFQEDRGTRTEIVYEYRIGRVLLSRVKGSGVSNKLD
jgi:hypothetical protein